MPLQVFQGLDELTRLLVLDDETAVHPLGQLVLGILRLAMLAAQRGQILTFETVQQLVEHVGSTTADGLLLLVELFLNGLSKEAELAP